MNNKNLDFDDIIRKMSSEDINNDDNIVENNNSSIYKLLISYITTLPPKQYILLSSLIGVLLIDDLEAKDQIILGKFISNIGQTILTAAAQEQINIKKSKEN